MDQIMVSIFCFAYNHESYIRDAMEGFLMQKTDFSFEIIVHDDASSDKTAEILKEYAAAHVNIKLILQEINQYSINPHLIAANMFQVASGKYIAYCEGDDYWCDPLKLQKQVAYMETHPNCSMCCHAVRFLHEGQFTEHNLKEKYGFLNTKKIIEMGATFIKTNSILFKTYLFSSLPNYYFMSTAGDYALMIYLSTCGSIYYMNMIMSVYRTFTTNSITSKYEKSIEFRIRSAKKTKKMLIHANRQTNFLYKSSFIPLINKCRFKRIKLYIVFLIKRYPFFNRFRVLRCFK